MWKLSLALAAISSFLLACPLLFSAARRRKQAFLLVSACFAVAAVFAGRIASVPLSTIEDFRPVAVASPPYAASTRCQDCHPGEFASWHASFHRTMTQVVGPNTVIGNFENVATSAYGHKIELTKRDDEFWVAMTDPEADNPATAQRIERPIVMSTGSHHMQVYWYATGKDRRLGQLPVVWLNETKAWVPIHSIFLRPTQTRLGKAEGRWNKTCIKCHTTHGQPRINMEPFPHVDTHVAEFGVACEACHGPAAEHAEGHLASHPAPANVVNPADIDHQKSAEVCGQCHGVWVAANAAEARRALAEGLSFRPGDTLSETRHIFASGQSANPHVRSHLESDPDFMTDRFWADDMVRVSGREYNGLIKSACFQKGTMSCISCHDLHARSLQTESTQDVTRWKDDQLGSDKESNGACVQCHTSLTNPKALQVHTHHAPDSAGSVCYNCHMPHTTYGLLKAIRSHQISSPSVQETVDIGRPNACNLCHVDQTLAWTASSLDAWYGIEAPPLTKDQRQISSMLLLGLTGDAGQRALAAWTLGWDAAQSASRTDWIAPLLGQLLNDPYHAVRFVAKRSLQSLPGYEAFDVDFLSADDVRSEAYKAIVLSWQQMATRREPSHAILIGSDGQMLWTEFQRLLHTRDDRVIVLAE